MTNIVQCELQGTVATITLDDGRANAMSPTMQRAINDALDQAETDKAAVVLAGRKRIFSAGFDLEILKNFNDETVTMLRGGFELAVRLMSFPAPVVIACTGHAMAMGSFLLCAADYRIGSAGEFKIGANEVAIGLTMPTPALAMLRHRLSPTAITRSVVLAEIFDPVTAVGVGFLDQIVDAENVVAEARVSPNGWLPLIAPHIWAPNSVCTKKPSMQFWPGSTPSIHAGFSPVSALTGLTRIIAVRSKHTN